MSALGSLVVKLALEYAQFSKGLEDSEQDVKKHAKSVQDAYDRMAAGVSERATNLRDTVVGVFAGAISVAGLMAAMGKVRTETVAAEQEQRQLEAAIKSTGQAAGWSLQQLNAMADTLADKTTFSAGELNQAQARMLSYSGIVGDTFPRAMQAAADMSARMGTSITASAESIGRALDIPSAGLTALTQQGFRFTEAQKVMVQQLERTGRVAEAQAIILEAVEASYGGAAAAARNSLGGALQAIANTVNDLMTADSASLPDLRESLEGLNSTLGDESVRAAVQSLVGSIVDLGSFAANTAASLVSLGTTAAQYKGEISVVLGMLAGAGTAMGAMKVVAAFAGAGGIVGALGKVRAAFLALTAVMAANPATLVMLGIGAAAGAAITMNSDPVGERINTELANQEERLRKAEALLERAGGPKGKMTERLEARIAGIKAHIETLRAASGQAVPAVEAVAETVNQLGDASGGINVPLAQTDEWIRRFGSTSQKAALEVAEWKRKLGDAFTPAMQAQVEDYWAKQDAGAKAGAQSAKQLQQAYETLKGSIAEKAATLRAELLSHEKLTESDKLRIKLNQDLQGSLAGLSAAKREAITQDINALAALEADVLARKTLLQLQEEERKHRQEWWAAQAKTVEELQESNQLLRAEIQLIGLNEQQQARLNRQRQEAVLLTREQQLAQLALAEDAVGFMSRQRIALEQEVEARRELLTLLDSRTAAQANASAAKKAAEDWEKTAQTVRDTLADYIMGGGRNAAQYLKRLFATLVLQPMVQTVVSGVLGGGASSASASAAGGSAGTSSLMNVVRTGQNLWSAATGGLTYALGSAAASIGAAIGSTAATSFGAGMAASGFTANAFSTGASLIGAGSTSTGLGMMAGAAMPWIAGGIALLSLVGGLKGIFGGKVSVRDQGVVGVLGGGEVRSYADMKRSGGWFGSNKYWTDYGGAVEGNAQLQTAFGVLRDNVSQQAKALNLSADAVANYTRSIRFSTKGLSGEQIVQRLEEEMAAAGDAMAALVLGTTKYTRAGESASATLQRLSSSLAVANVTLETLGGKLYDVGLAGADAASKLVERFGSVDAYLSASDAYYKAYYSQAERAGSSTRAMAQQLKALGLTLPTTQAGFKELVSSLDLTTDYGRQAYAVLLGIAPQFDETARVLADLARTAAAELIATYTRAAAVAPGMQVARDAMAAAASSALGLGGSVSSIHKILGDASSGVLTWGSSVQASTAALSPAQLAVHALQAEILDLQSSASGTVLNIEGLSKALQGVDARTWAATIGGAFELIAQRIRSGLASIVDERASVREAAIGIIGAAVMTPAQIRAQIAQQTVKLPGQGGIATAQSALAKADALVAQREKELLIARTANATTGANALTAAQALESARGDAARNLVATYLRYGNVQNGIRGEAVPGSLAGLAVYNDTQANMLAKLKGLPTAEIQAFADQLATLSTSGMKAVGSTNTYLSWLAKYREAVDAEAVNAAKAQTLRSQAAVLADKASAAEKALTAARTVQSTAAGAAQKAQLDYVAALQKYSLDSSKAVTGLGKLREETVAWYQSQQALAQTMASAASGLRSTVADIRFGQMDTAAQFANLQERFNVAYSMAMATTGETLAGYGSEMNALLNPLLQKAQETGMSAAEYSSLVSTMLARAEAIAGRLETNAPKNYQEESLGLLGQIDSTLAALEAGAKTADEILVEAVKAGSDVTRDGLRAVIAAITGKTVPAFAAGGFHSGGWRLVGERGPELEATGPARYFNADQTARMLSGAGSGRGLDALLSELSALRREVQGLRVESKAGAGAIATNTGRTERMLDRLAVEGMPVRNVDGEQLRTVQEVT